MRSIACGLRPETCCFRRASPQSTKPAGPHWLPKLEVRSILHVRESGPLTSAMTDLLPSVRGQRALIRFVDPIRPSTGASGGSQPRTLALSGRTGLTLVRGDTSAPGCLSLEAARRERVPPSWDDLETLTCQVTFVYPLFPPGSPAQNGTCGGRHTGPESSVPQSSRA